ncbi:MAG: metallopeptidase family protein [Candidatus Paceibacteria bacterium]
METDDFKRLVSAAVAGMPERFRKRLENVAILVEDEPSTETLREHGIAPGAGTLLGLYHGIPQTERGSEYGVGATLPDTITIYRLPILETAEDDGKDVATVVQETVWHEVAHYFGMEEHEVGEREADGTNRYH